MTSSVLVGQSVLSKQTCEMMFAVLCAVLIGSVSGAATTVSPITRFFSAIDVNPTDGVVTNAEFHKAAYTYDVDGNGTITQTEFVSLYQTSVGVPHSQAEATFGLIDANHDGVFDDKEISAVFSVFDGNGDGQITLTEFVAGFARFSSGHGANG